MKIVLSCFVEPRVELNGQRGTCLIFFFNLFIYPLDILKPNILCCVNENLKIFLYTLTGGTRNIFLF